ncbi:MAG TPA: hypothetical protein VHO49_04690 [Anaerolineales bacterium]|nr:hypothetical protein [Anaerolineales bacterium]
MKDDMQPTVQAIVTRILADPAYQKNIEYGLPRPGHPEGKVRLHIADLEANLERLRQRGISEEEYWKLKLLIHVHDTFKAEAKKDVPILHPRSHATLARQFAARFTDDEDLLNMIQYHDQNYSLWLDYLRTGSLDRTTFQTLLDTIQDWDLFLMFTIIDGRTAGKDKNKLGWFIEEVRKHKPTRVDTTWVDGEAIR